MGNMAIMRPYPNVALVSGPGIGASNILTPDPKESWVPPLSGAFQAIQIDLGSLKLIDSAFIMGIFAVGTAWGLTTANDSAFSVNVQGPVGNKIMPMARSSGAMAKDYVTFAPIVCRYLSFGVVYTNGSIGASAPQVGIAQVGRSFIPQYGREYGSGRPIIDTGSADRLISGGFGVNQGVRKSGYNFTLGDLSIAEKDFLFNELLGVGQTGPVIMVEDITPPDMPPLVDNGNMSIAGRVATKNAGGAGWNAGAVSASGFAGKGLVIGKPQQANSDLMFGLNSDPLTDNNFTSLDYAISIISNGNYQAAESGTVLLTQASYVANDIFAIAYDDGALRYAKNDVLVRSVADVGSNRTFSLDSSFNTAGGAATLNFYGPDGFSEGVHYGLITKIDAYERVNVNLNKWSLQMEEWV